MGNGLSPCLQQSPRRLVKLVFWGGSTRFLAKTQLAGELMCEFPDRIICHADSFYIGRPLPVLSIGDILRTGETYFVLPVDRFPCHTLTATSLACLSSDSKPSTALVSQCPFKYIKGTDGRTLIKVPPEFISRVITGGSAAPSCGGDVGGGRLLCSTPELQKHYSQLVGSRDRPWSPNLETIAEKKIRLSPSRFLTGAIRLSPTRLLASHA